MINYAGKEAGDEFTHGDANEIKDQVNLLFPRTEATFVPATGVLLDRVTSTIYNQYQQSGDVTLTICDTIDSPIRVAAVAILPIICDGNDVNVSIPEDWSPSGYDPLDPSSDVASTTVGAVDKYIFWVENDRIMYTIKNM